MEERIIIGGLGGQGVLVIGKVLSHACVLEGKEITYMEGYGDSVRGGVVSCSLVVSDESIASPIVEEPTICVALSKSFMKSFEKRLSRGGRLILNRPPNSQINLRKDISALEIPATELALELGNVLLTNMVALGGLIGFTKISRLESVFQGVERTLPEHRKSMAPMNIRGIEKGHKYYLSNSQRKK